MAEAFERGDVFWAPDPIRPGTNPRLWLVLASETLPYPGEEYLCAALTTSDLPDNHEVGEKWVTGGHPDRASYCSPWVLSTIKHRAVANPQSRVTAAFVEAMVERAKAFLGP